MSGPSVEITFLSKGDVDRIITWEDVLAGVEDTFRSDGNGQLTLPAKFPLMLQDGCMLLPMMGYLADLGAAGQKWMRFHAAQPDGIPTLWGQLLIMNDARTGLPIAIMDATTITDMRTSGGHAVVAARHLARKNPRVLGVLGAGAQGKAGIESFDRHFELEEIRVYTRRESTRESCRRSLADKLRARMVFVDAPVEITRNADMILTCSGSREPLIMAGDIPKGCFVAGISNFYDLDAALSRRADKWVLGHLGGDKLQIVDNERNRGKLSMEDVYGSLGEVVAGKKPGRQREEETILYTHMGMGALDVAVGRRLLEKAARLDVGQKLRLI